jgi:hypothetical protein
MWGLGHRNKTGLPVWRSYVSLRNHCCLGRWAQRVSTWPKQTPAICWATCSAVGDPPQLEGEDEHHTARRTREITGPDHGSWPSCPSAPWTAGPFPRETSCSGSWTNASRGLSPCCRALNLSFGYAAATGTSTGGDGNLIIKRQWPVARPRVILTLPRVGGQPVRAATLAARHRPASSKRAS